MSESVAAPAAAPASPASVAAAAPAAVAAPAAAPAAPAASTPPAAAAPVVPVPAAAPAAAAPATPAAPAAQPPAPAKAEATTPAAVIEIELKLPTGAQYDPTAIGDFKSIMADPKLTPSQRAQAVIDLNEKTAAANLKLFQEKAAAQIVADEAALKADKEYGGQRFEKTVADARSVLTKTKHGPAVSKLLETLGLHKQPDVVKLLAEFRGLLAEDSTSQRVPGTQTTPETKPPVTSQTQRLAQRYAKTT